VPDVPTFAEVGFADVTASTYWGVLAPKGAPKEAIDRLSAEFTKALGDPEIVSRIAVLGYLPIGAGPADFAANLRSEIKKWGDVIARAKYQDRVGCIGPCRDASATIREADQPYLWGGMRVSSRTSPSSSRATANGA
jgi:Tripartite tricarboxylate transporter family receptor